MSSTHRSNCIKYELTEGMIIEVVLDPYYWGQGQTIEIHLTKDQINKIKQISNNLPDKSGTIDEAEDMRVLSMIGEETEQRLHRLVNKHKENCFNNILDEMYNKYVETKEEEK